MRGSRWLVATLVLVFGVATGAKAQEAVDFGRLSAAVKPGDALIVTDSVGRQTKAYVLDVSPESLMLLSGLTSSAITEIAVDRRDSIWNGVLIGLAVAGTPWLITCAANDWCYYNEYGSENLLRTMAITTAAAGAGLGVLFDLSVRKRITIYKRAKGERVTIGAAPAISLAGAGIQISTRF